MEGLAEQMAAPFAAMHLVLIGDMLPAGIDIGEDAAEAMLRIKPCRARRLKETRRDRAAAFGRRRHLEFVFQPLFLRWYFAALCISGEVAHIAMEQQLHLVDRMIGIADCEQRIRILDRAAIAEP